MIDNIIFSEIDNGNIIVMETSFNIDGIYLFLKRYYEQIVSKIFSDKDVKLITVNPNERSLSRELNNGVRVKMNKDKIDVNTIKNASKSILGDAVDSLDFETGNLVIALDVPKQANEIVTNIYNWIKEVRQEKYTSQNEFTFCFCEGDGYFFYLVNTGFTIPQLKQLGNLSETID